MTNKIINFLELPPGKEINFKNIVEKIKSKLIIKSRETQVKFCFDLFDDDGNGRICLRDIDIFNRQYGGVCLMLTSDYNDIAKHLNQKITGQRPPYVPGLAGKDGCSTTMSKISRNL